MMDNLEHGWVGSEPANWYGTAEKEAISRCACCGEEIYEDEDYYTYVYTEDGKLICWDCHESGEYLNEEEQ